MVEPELSPGPSARTGILVDGARTEAKDQLSANASSDLALKESAGNALVYLSPPTTEDYPILYRWFSDLSEIHLWTAARSSMGFDEFVADLLRRMQQNLIVVAREGAGRPIAFFQLYDIAPCDGTAAFLVYLDKHYRNAAHGSLATVEFLSYVCRIYALRKIYADSYEFNKYSALLLLSGGFREEGRLRQHVWWKDRYWDQIKFSCTRKTVEALSKRLLGPWSDGLGRNAPTGFGRAEAQRLYLLIVRAAGPNSMTRAEPEGLSRSPLDSCSPDRTPLLSNDACDFLEMIYADRDVYSEEEGWPRLRIWTKDEWGQFLVPPGHTLHVCRDDDGRLLAGLVSRDEHFKGESAVRIWVWASDSSLTPELRTQAGSRVCLECAVAAQERGISKLFVYVIAGSPRSSSISRLLGVQPETVFDQTAIVLASIESAIKVLRLSFEPT